MPAIRHLHKICIAQQPFRKRVISDHFVFCPDDTVHQTAVDCSKLAAIDSSLVHCIIGAEDEVIGDHAFTKRLLCDADLVQVPNGRHSGATLPLQSFFQTVLKEEK